MQMDREETWTSEVHLEMSYLERRMEKIFESDDYMNCLREIDEIDHPSNVLKILKAKCLFHLDDFEEAKKVAKEILADNPKEIEAVLVFANGLYHQGDLSASIEAYTEILKAQPELQHVKEQLEKAKSLIELLRNGRHFYEKGKYRNASRTFSQAYEVDQTNKKVTSVILNNRAMTLKQLRYFKGAIEDFDESLKLNPGDKTVHEKRAICFYKLKRFVECINDCEEAMKVRASKDIIKLMEKCLAKLKKEKKKNSKDVEDDGADIWYDAINNGND